ncbi:hypothetical protein [Hymenobacter sp. UYCo722]|uniref:hypothetical protein n=1 Tax=Hymenobacter sp. UYCo722 TaxID=3156335 RepID=UPI003395C82D
MFFASLLGARAQEAPSTIRLLPEDAQRGLNGHQQNFYFLPPGVVGENYVNAGFFGQKLRPLLAGNQEALDQLDLYKQQKTKFLIDRIVAVASFGVYGQQIFAHGDRRYFDGATQQVAISVFAASILGTLFINRNTNSYFQRAVGAYNGTNHMGHGAVWPRLRPAGIEIGQVSTGQPTLGLRWAVR